MIFKWVDDRSMSEWKPLRNQPNVEYTEIQAFGIYTQDTNIWETILLKVKVT